MHALVAAMADAGVDDMFLIGGDADPAQGTYSSAVELLRIVAEHPRRPRTIGIAGYPEGHPLISERAIQQALRAKSRFTLRFVRKQRGVRSLLSGRSATDRLHDAITPMLDDPQLNITGVHYFTFNQLLDTWRWQYEKQHESVHRFRRQAVPNGYVNPEGTTA